jgi:hypothetical protein
MIWGSAYCPEFGSTEAAAVDHRDEQSITFGKAAMASQAAAIMRFTSSAIRYSRLRLASFG